MPCKCDVDSLIHTLIDTRPYAIFNFGFCNVCFVQCNIQNINKCRFVDNQANCAFVNEDDILQDLKQHDFGVNAQIVDYREKIRRAFDCENTIPVRCIADCF